MIVLVSIMATACNLFDALFSDEGVIKDADVEVVSGLKHDLDDNVYLAELNKKFILSIDWHSTGVVAPKIAWYMVEGEVKTDLKGNIIHDPDTLMAGCTAKRLEYKFDTMSEETYSFYAVVSDKVVTNVITVKIVHASLSTPTLTSTTHTIDGGTIQQRLVEMSDVQLQVDFNADDLSPDTVVEIEWYVDKVLMGEDSKEFVYEVSQIDAPTTVLIEVVIYTDITEKKSASVYLTFIDLADMVQDVDIDVVDGVQEVATDTFYLYGLPTDNVTINLSAQVEPLTANMKADCKWEVQDKNGDRELPTTDRDITLLLTYGKNVISACVENIESSNIIVYVLQYEYDDLSSDIKNAIEQKFFWKGDLCDRYINNMTDLSCAMGYFTSLHTSGVANHMYVACEDMKDSDAFIDACSQAIEIGNDESGRFRYSTTIALSGSATLTFKSDTVFGIPSGATETDYQVKQANNYVRYSEVATKRTSLPIDSSSKSISVATSNDLYNAVSYGYKPIFANNEAGQALEALYQKARDVLFKYIDDEMSDLEKIAVIHDWIVNEVDYDYKAADQTSSGSGYNAFYLEGVFNDHRAVCDGKSKAFALLCGIEGIPVMRIIGKAGHDGQMSGHAWNKVLVDTDGDNVREWFNIDTTWDDTTIRTSDKVCTEYLNYAYYLVSDAVMEDTHVSTVKQPVANTDYNVFADTIIEVGKLVVRKVSLLVDDTFQFNNLLEYSESNGNMALCVYFEKKPINATYNSIELRDGIYIIIAL